MFSSVFSLYVISCECNDVLANGELAEFAKRGKLP